MNTLLFASGAFLLLLPFLKFIPLKLAFKKKVYISFISFCITILALIGSDFLPFISVLAVLVLLTGLTAYLAESRIQNGINAQRAELQPEPLSPAAQYHEPKIYETTIEHNVDAVDDETESEDDPEKDIEDDFIEEEQQDYIKELDWEDIQPVVSYEAEGQDAFEFNEAVAEEELPSIEDGIPDSVKSPSPFQMEEEEEEYNRLFSGRKR